MCDECFGLYICDKKQLEEKADVLKKERIDEAMATAKKERENRTMVGVGELKKTCSDFEKYIDHRTGRMTKNGVSDALKTDLSVKNICLLFYWIFVISCCLHINTQYQLQT